MKIFCVGRNYVAHAHELGNDVPSQPVIFMKPQTALIRNGKPVFYPKFTKDLHYEGELVVRISKNGKKIKKQFVKKYYDDVSIGFDLTARDIQAEQKKKGLPWEIAKGFDGAAPLGKFINKAEAINDKGEIEYKIFKNGEQVQHGNTALMIFNIDEIISYISHYFLLQRGDFIFTGTPKGVGPLAIGDNISGSIKGKELINNWIR